MPKIDNNPIMKGASGMLGGVVVYRQFRGMTIMSNRPKKAKVITPHQQAIKSRFLLAVEYAKKQIADPVLKAKYEPDPGSKFTSAYVAAIADYLRSAKQNEKIENNQNRLGPAVCVNAETNVVKGHEQQVRTDANIAHRYTVKIPYPHSTIIPSNRCVEMGPRVAAKNRPQLSDVSVRRREPFARCFHGDLRSREPTHTRPSQ
jgi:hypothetical protein